MIYRERKGNRIIAIDGIRSFCIFWIVGIWHYSNYVAYVSDVINHELFTQITFGILAVFVLLSGLLAGQKKISSFKEAIAYIGHRLMCLYPLYFIGCLGFKTLGLYSTHQFTEAVCLIGVFSSEAPITLWFLNMIIVFDILIVPVACFNDILWQVLYSLVMWGGIVILTYNNMLDERLMFYWPVFVASSVSSKLIKFLKKDDTKNEQYVLSIIVAIIILFVLFLSKKISDQFSILSYFVAFIVFILLWGITGLLKNSFFVQKVFNIISGASFCMYLFHRQFYSCIVHFIGTIPLWMGYLIVLPILVAVSYLIQCMYNKLCLTLRRKES